MIFKQPANQSGLWHYFNKSIRSFNRHFVFIVKSFKEDECVMRAASLTYTSLLAIVPLMTVSFAIFSAFPVFTELRQPVEDFIFNNFVPATGVMLQDYFIGFVNQTGRLSIFGLIFLLVTAILLMFTIERAMNRIWRVRANRSPVSKFLLYWAVLTLAPILMGVSFTISSYLISLPLLAKIDGLGTSSSWFLTFLPFLFSMGTFTLLYVAVPNCRVRLSHGLIGAIVASVLFELAKKGFSFYFQNFGNYELLYGAFAAIPLFLLWLYWMWLIILLGAEVAHALSAYYQHRSDVKVDGFTHALHWLGHLWHQQQSGQGLKLMQLVDRDQYNYQIPPDQMITILLKENLIMVAQNEVFILSRDLSQMSLYELNQALPWPYPDAEYLQNSQFAWDRSLEKIFGKLQSYNRDALKLPVASIFSS